MATVLQDKSLGGGLRARTVRVLYSELTTNGTAQNVNLGSALPTGAEVVASWYRLKEAFTSGSVTGLTAEVGTSADTDAFVTAGQVLSGSPTLTRRHIKGAWITATGATPLARFNSSGANLGNGTVTNLTAGKLDVTVVYAVVKDL